MIIEIASSVAIVSCGSYDTKEVQDAVARALDLLGGIRELIRKHTKVLLKVNKKGRW